MLRVVLAADVDSLDPHLASRPSSWWFARAIHRGLYAYRHASDGTRPVPDIAAALPSRSEDGRTLTIGLRDDVMFSDGRGVTAPDVRASLQRLMRARVGIAPHLVARSGVPGGITAIDVVDERTIRIRLARPANDLTWLLAHPQAAILPADARAAPRALVGAGPYRIASFRPERRIMLERNPGWTRTADPIRAAWVDGVDARIGLDRAEARADVAAGLVDLVLDPGPPDAPEGVSSPALRIERVDPGCTRYLFLDPRVQPFARTAVRRAVAHAVDRGAFVAGTGAVVAGGALPPPVVGSVAEPSLPTSLERSRALLARANLAEGFTATLTVGTTARDRRDAARVRAALARVGITVRVRTVPPASLYPLYYADPDERLAMGIATWCADWPGRAGRGVLVPLGAPSMMGEQRVPARPDAGGALRTAIARALLADDDAAAGRWADADAALAASGLVIPLAWPTEEVAIGPGVGGWSSSPMFPRGDPTQLWVGAGGGA